MTPGVQVEQEKTGINNKRLPVVASQPEGFSLFIIQLKQENTIDNQ